MYSEEWKAPFSTSVDWRLLVWYSGKLIGQYINRTRKSDCFGTPLLSVGFYPHKDHLFVGGQGEMLIFEVRWGFIERLHNQTEVLPFDKHLVMKFSFYEDSIHRILLADQRTITASRDKTIGNMKLDQSYQNSHIETKTGTLLLDI